MSMKSITTITLSYFIQVLTTHSFCWIIFSSYFESDSKELLLHDYKNKMVKTQYHVLLTHPAILYNRLSNGASNDLLHIQDKH